jgi:prolyl-tRNA synthetase
MKLSRFFVPTLKEDPQEAEAVSHKLMVRAGMTRRLTAGAYIYMPMGLRVLRKAEKIVREEMEKAGAIELFMPALQPAELWKKTGRYDVIGDVMIKFKDRHGREVALGPTHEEVITDLVSREIHSYKELPLILFQIQTKFRDEVRPRFGVVRSCEFIMKDAYSFDASAEGLEESYRKMYEAYCRVFERCGLPYVPVEADTGLMGGRMSHEFMIPCEIGEDRIALCSSCGYAASTEVAGINKKEGITVNPSAALTAVDTPGASSVKDVASFLDVPDSKLVKTLIYAADGVPVAILIRGDHEANEAKIKNELKAVKLELAGEKTIVEVTGGAAGFSGPVGLKVPIYGDLSVEAMSDFVVGANAKDRHMMNANHGRDFMVREWFDARVITEEDKCPKCSCGIEIKNAIEVGHTFKLGTKYSESLGANFLDEKGGERVAIMGCYGIGVNRILATLIETSHDSNGIIWPAELAPFEVAVIPVNKDDAMVNEEAEKIYSILTAEHIDVILDDRKDKSAGVKFKDADLIGYPIQIVLGRKSLDQGKVEVKERASGKTHLIDKDQAAVFARDIILKLKSGN